MSYITDSRFYYVNSRLRRSGTDCNFSYKLDVPPNSGYTHIAVLNAVIPKSYYLVQEGYNTFRLSENGNEITITIPVGNYSRQSFRSKLQQLLNANSPNNCVYTVSIPGTGEPDTGKYTFNVSGNGGVQPIFNFDQNNIHEQLGFDPESTNQFIGNVMVSKNVIKFQIEDALFLRSNIVDNGVDNVLQMIPLVNNPDFSDVIFTNQDVLGYSKKLSHNTSNIYDFSLTDEDGVFMELNGQNMVFSVMLYKKSNIYDILENFIKLKLIEK